MSPKPAPQVATADEAPEDKSGIDTSSKLWHRPPGTSYRPGKRSGDSTQSVGWRKWRHWIKPGGYSRQETWCVSKGTYWKTHNLMFLKWRFCSLIRILCNWRIQACAQPHTSGCTEHNSEKREAVHDDTLDEETMSLFPSCTDTLLCVC